MAAVKEFLGELASMIESNNDKYSPLAIQLNNLMERYKGLMSLATMNNQNASSRVPESNKR